MKTFNPLSRNYLILIGITVLIATVLYFITLPVFVQRVGGSTGLALEFNGVSDFVYVPTVNVGSVFSVEILFNSDISGDYATLIDDNWQFGSMGSLYYESNELHWWFKSQKKLFVSGLATSTWYHLAFVSDESTVSIYINGELKTSGNFSIFSVNYNNDLRIGDSADDLPWDGKVDEFRVYNRSLSAGEVLEHSQGIFNDETGLQILYHFNEALSLIARDSSGHGNDGVIFGGSWVIGPPQSFPDISSRGRNVPIRFGGFPARSRSPVRIR